MISEPCFDGLGSMEGGPVMDDGAILEPTLVSTNVAIEDVLVSMGVQVASVLREDGTLDPYCSPYMDCCSEVGDVMSWCGLTTSDPYVITCVTKHHGALVHEHIVVGVVQSVLPCPGDAGHQLTCCIDNVNGGSSTCESELTTAAAEGSITHGGGASADMS